MPSSDNSSSSSLEITGAASPRSVRARTADAGNVDRSANGADFASPLHNQDSGDALSRKHGEPRDFAAPPTGAYPLPSFCPTGAEGKELSVQRIIQSMRAVAPAADTDNVKTEPAVSRKQRTQDEGKEDGRVCRAGLSTLPADHISSESCRCFTPGFDPKPRRLALPHIQDGRDSDNWEAARKTLESIVTPSRELSFAAAKPSDIVASTYPALLQAVNHVCFSSDHGRKLEEKLAAGEWDAAPEVAALREQLGKKRAELAVAKQVTESKLQSVKAAAVQEFQASTEHKRQLAGRAVVGYERGMEDLKRVALRLDPRLDAAQLVVPPGGPLA